ncbi:hypothetical protein BV22DRAFT_920227 [Leucogyrophana mollusca]|uniref:Uncharacterized protein n=1 Tax=Leucogyrophana mollusca TaxID=85980 RepID=A0ACB8AYH2_9AGAM|nr:hypothetical protein BV22DRAFT_920227 [Leucogyrophana mollusca]
MKPIWELAKRHNLATEQCGWFDSSATYDYNVYNNYIDVFNTSTQFPAPGASTELFAHSSSTASARTSQQSFDPINFTTPPASVPQAIAEYLLSARPTTLLKLTRYPHAPLGHSLTVSLADMGDPHGFPLIVFLGLGCVRRKLGLYDEMADCLGLRLFTSDRWGLGRTESQSKSLKGIMKWASAVEEVLDLLNIYECSIMAHSAGAPYAYPLPIVSQTVSGVTFTIGTYTNANVAAGSGRLEP